MTDENEKPKLELVPPTEEELDEEEQEFRVLCRDLPGVKGASAAASLPSPWGRRRPRRVLPLSPGVPPDRSDGQLRDGMETARLR